ncbi:MAG: Hydrolase 4 protein [Thermodesulfobacteriota bacterium]|nr:Hydrolase 4 protein [Thermodesulfobacteriota bacterium]
MRRILKAWGVKEMKTIRNYYAAKAPVVARRSMGMALLLSVAVVMIAGCATPSPRLQPSGLNTTFALGEDVPFASVSSEDPGDDNQRPGGHS